MTGSGTQSKVAVWDPLVRLFHWGLVASFAVCYFTQERNYNLHLQSGYAVMGLVGFRLLWGFVGTRHARFADFVRGPSAALGYLAALVRRQAPRYLGHNPAGGLMIVALLLCMIVLVTSGIALDAAENRAGPLGHTRLYFYRDWILDLHQVATDVSVVLVALHVLGVAADSLLHRENLVLAMITGKKV